MANDIQLTQEQANEIIEKQMFSQTINDLAITPKWFYTYRTFFSLCLRQMTNGCSLTDHTEDGFLKALCEMHKIKDDVFFVLEKPLGTFPSEWYLPIEGVQECVILASEYNDANKFWEGPKFSKQPRLVQKTYIMYDEHTGYYKIGKSTNPAYREKTLRSDKPTVKLVLVCDKNIETNLHQTYKSSRIRGEWFNLTSNEILDIINQHGFKKP